MQNLEFLKPALEKNATVVFTWPSVVDKEGNGCYQSKPVQENLPKFVAEIRQTLEAHGFIVAGEPIDSVYPSEFMHDTYYHIVEPKAAERTEKLAQRMKEAGIAPAARPYRAGDSIKALLAEVNALLARFQ